MWRWDVMVVRGGDVEMGCDGGEGGGAESSRGELKTTKIVTALSVSSHSQTNVYIWKQ